MKLNLTDMVIERTNKVLEILDLENIEISENEFNKIELTITQSVLMMHDYPNTPRHLKLEIRYDKTFRLWDAIHGTYIKTDKQKELYVI